MSIPLPRRFWPLFEFCGFQCLPFASAAADPPRLKGCVLWLRGDAGVTTKGEGEVVSKNGNLLLNIPVKGDGSLDDQELAFLADLTRWMDVNSECIYGTRPWKVFRDAPAGGPKKPSEAAGADAPPEIRFTTKGDALYAVAFGWPKNGRLLIRSLASGSAG